MVNQCVCMIKKIYLHGESVCLHVESVLHSESVCLMRECLHGESVCLSDEPVWAGQSVCPVIQYAWRVNVSGESVCTCVHMYVSVCTYAIMCKRCVTDLLLSVRTCRPR